MAGGIHFEIFCRKGKGSWALNGVATSREKALAEAKELIASGAAGGVRVFKETFNADSGEFQTLKIFEDGDVSEKKTKTTSSTEGSSLPCFKPDDFYSFHGRRAIARLMRDSLTRWRITVTELMHHAGHVERLELTGTVLQGAVQKAAIKHAGATGEPVQQIVKQLNELVSRAMERVILDGRKERFPSIAKEGFGPLCTRLAAAGGGEYFANAAIAYHIEDAKSWGEKLDRVLGLMGELPAEEGPGRALGLKLIDSLVGELVTGNAAIADLLGEQPDLGAALVKMSEIFLATTASNPGDLPGVKALRQEFARGNLVNSRTAIGQRILQEIEGVRRLKPASIDDEVKIMRSLATKMVMGQGSLLGQEEILEAFIARSKQLVTPDIVDDYLSGLSRPTDRLDKLMTLEENVIGAANKRSLVAFVSGLLSAHRTEAFVIDSNDPPPARFAVLGKLSQRIQKSGFQELSKRQLAEQVDALAVKLEKKTGFVETTFKSARSPLERAEKALGLIVNAFLPEGLLANDVRARVRELLRDSSFKQALAEASPERRAALGALLAKSKMDIAAPKDAAA